MIDAACFCCFDGFVGWDLGLTHGFPVLFGVAATQVSSARYGQMFQHQKSQATQHLGLHPNARRAQIKTRLLAGFQCYVCSSQIQYNYFGYFFWIFQTSFATNITYTFATSTTRSQQKHYNQLGINFATKRKLEEIRRSSALTCHLWRKFQQVESHQANGQEKTAAAAAVTKQEASGTENNWWPQVVANTIWLQ